MVEVKLRKYGFPVTINGKKGPSQDAGFFDIQIARVFLTLNI